LDQTIAPFLTTKKEFAILDPSCGSGIFLVNSYRRMIEKHLNGKTYSNDDSMLIGILTKNIYGIDTNKDAIDVAIFSLYLTALDYKDPKTLKQFPLPNIKDINLIECDFFDESDNSKLERLKKIKFNFIFGNPPWGSKTGLHQEYCDKHGHTAQQQNNEICRSFVFRVKDFSNDTQCCLILHSKLLYNQKKPAKKFREYILENTIIEKIIELSSVRKLVFKNANGPAFIIMFKYVKNDCSHNRMTYISLKPNAFFKLFNIIVVEKSDIKYIEQNFLIQYDWAWKTAVFGLSGDIDVIRSLKNKFPKIAKHIEDEFSNYYGAGIKYADGDQQDASHLIGLPLVHNKDSIEHFHINLSDTKTFIKQKIDRSRHEKKQLFDSPSCLINKWIDKSDYTMHSAFSKKKIVYTDSVYIIKGSNKQKNDLLNLVGLFNSSLFGYLNLMLGSSAGIERNQCLMTEIFNFPYLYNDNISTQVENIQKLGTEFTLDIQSQTKQEYDKLNKLILEKFNLKNNNFVDYALRIQIPQLTGYADEDSRRDVNKNDMLKYSKYFDDYFSSIYEKSRKYVALTFYLAVANRFTIFELKI
jgi:methylase of polypeptide subunit release factors